MLPLEELERLANAARAEHARREKSLHEALEGLSLVLETSLFPMWVKRLVIHPGGALSTVMVRINQAYVDTWGVKREEYEGKNDRVVWGDEIGGAYAQNDFAAYRQSPAPYDTVEPVPAAVERDTDGTLIPAPVTDATPVWRIRKTSCTVSFGGAGLSGEAETEVLIAGFAKPKGHEAMAAYLGW